MSSSNASLHLSSTQRILEFDMYDLVGIRLINPTDHDVSIFVSELGLNQTNLQRQPEITLRFIESFSVANLNYLGLNSAGFTDDGFYLLDYKSGSVQAQIPFQLIGEHCEIVCRSGLGFIPLLFEVINFSLMKKGFVSLHASAFSYNGNGILVMGWEKGGKTETLLSFGNNKARYIGDEMVVLSSDGEKMFGIPIPIAVWEWQLKYLHRLIPKTDIQQKILSKIILFLDKFHGIFGRGWLKNILPLGLLGEALPTLKRRLKIWAIPHVLFEDQIGDQGIAPDKIFLVMSHDSPEISIQRCDPNEVARRMVSSNEYERMHFFQYYKAFKFAFPHLSNEFLENIDEIQHSLLFEALAGKETYKVLHPYPIPLDRLFKEMLPYVTS